MSSSSASSSSPRASTCSPPPGRSSWPRCPTRAWWSSASAPGAPALEELLGALAAGDLDAARAIAEAGREAEGGPRAPLRHLLAFLDGLDGPALEAYRAAAARLGERVVITGRLEHDELAPLLAACEAQVVPSTFPEAFGMVAAEAAACGALPLSAAHSGLAEVSAILAGAVPEQARASLSFTVGDGAVHEIAQRLVWWLRAPGELREATREALVSVARRRFSWDGVAAGVVAAAEGRHEALVRPPQPGATASPAVRPKG